jgi:hypothetical protein
MKCDLFFVLFLLPIAATDDDFSWCDLSSQAQQTAHAFLNCSLAKSQLTTFHHAAT